MPNLGPMELVILVLVIAVLFGWKKLPDAARSLGRSARIFKAEVDEMKHNPSAASRDTVQGETRRDTLRPEDHRTDAPRTESAAQASPQARPESPVKDAHAPRDEDTQYRPPMA